MRLYIRAEMNTQWYKVKSKDHYSKSYLFIGEFSEKPCILEKWLSYCGINIYWLELY